MRVAKRLQIDYPLASQRERVRPISRLPAGLEVQVPSEFAHYAVSVLPVAALRAVRAVSARSGLRGPWLKVEHVLEILDERYGFTDAVRLLREESGTAS
jgi:hypothetical protein